MRLIVDGDLIAMLGAEIHGLESQALTVGSPAWPDRDVPDEIVRRASRDIERSVDAAHATLLDPPPFDVEVRHGRLQVGEAVGVEAERIDVKAYGRQLGG